MRLRVFAASVLLLFSGALRAAGNDYQLATGSQLLSVCGPVVDQVGTSKQNSMSVRDAASCIQYINGFVEGVDLVTLLNDTPPLYCLPDSVRVVQLAAIVVKYLKENPKVQHKNSSVVVSFALGDAFPCQQKK